MLCLCEHSENAVVQNANCEGIVRANYVRKQYAEMQFDTGERGAILQTLCLSVQTGDSKRSGDALAEVV